MTVPVSHMTVPARSLLHSCTPLPRDPTVLSGCTFTNDEERETLMTNIQHRLTPHPVKIRADVEVSCYSYEGIDAVKAALRRGLAQSTEEMPLKVDAAFSFFLLLSSLRSVVADTIQNGIHCNHARTHTHTHTHTHRST